MSIRSYLEELNLKTSKKIVDINAKKNQVVLENKTSTKDENIDSCCLK